MESNGRKAFKKRKAAERLGAAPALGLAVFDELGIARLIDDTCGYDGSSALSPGNAVKAICGTMFTENKRKALMNVERFYECSPVSGLFGKNVTLTSLNDTELGRAIDTIYKCGTTDLFYNISSRIHGKLQLESKFYHLDASNITVYKNPDQDDDEVPGLHPMFGKPKDKHDELMQINFESIVDEFGLQSYLKAHNGNESDMKMAMDALKYVEDEVAKKSGILVADCKVVYAEMVDRLVWDHIPFVSKCPDNFGESVRSRVLDKVRGMEFTHVGRIGKRKDSPEYEIVDVNAVANGDSLRFIAYRCSGSKTDRSIEYYRKQGGKRMGSVLGRFANRKFDCENDAQREFNEYASMVADQPFIISHSICSETVPGKRKHRGRPRKDEPDPEPVTIWRVNCTWEFDEAKARSMADDYNIRVIITTLPRSEKTCKDLTEGATAEDVLRTYLGQWRVESVFGEYKSKVGADTLFLQNGSRIEVLLFIIAIAVLVRNVIKLLLRMKQLDHSRIPKNVTPQKLFRLLANVIVEIDPSDGSIIIDGTEEGMDILLESCEKLSLDPSCLLG